MDTKTIQEQSKPLVDFHFQALQGMYFSEYLKKDGYVLLYSDLIEDSYYNYAAQNTIISKNIYIELEEFFVERNRVPAIYVTPCSKYFNNRVSEEYTSWATDAWMILDNIKFIHNYKIPAYITIEEVNISDRDKYVEVFEKAYGSDDPDDPYGQLPPYYGQSLHRSFENNIPNYDCIYIGAKIDGSLVGIASMLWNNDIAGVYSVGTIEPKRHRGVGTSMMKYLINLSKDNSVSTMVLQTEKGSFVEKWYKNLGFKTLFDGVYYVKE